MASLSVKKKARSRINNAIRDKHINRPILCQWRKEVPRLGKDGRSLVQFHHFDYRQAALGAFICAKCHKQDYQ